MRKAVLLINALSANPTSDELDVLVQASAVEGALDRLKWHHRRVFCDLNLDRTLDALEQEPPDVVFNLVESLGGKGALIHLPAWLLETLRIPFTGSPARSLTITTDKVWTKQLLREKEIPTPDWFLMQEGRAPAEAPYSRNLSTPDPNKKYILKPIREDGSAGITDSSVVEGTAFGLAAPEDHTRGLDHFAEEYIDGREFNITLLDGPEGIQVMPAAEMLYVNYPEGKPRILNYASKWDPDSFEYEKTIRSFELPSGDLDLVRRMKEISLACREIFDLRGYARVDFRVDRFGNPFVLEVNANPCISPDAGFTAACARGGIDYTAMIERIMESAQKQLR